MTIDETLTAIDRIADDLARVAAALDANTFKVDSAVYRGVLSRMHNAARDAAAAMRRPR